MMRKKLAPSANCVTFSVTEKGVSRGKVANRLTKCIRASDIAARQGGDEFLILLNDNVNLNFVQSVASKLIAELSRTYKFEDNIMIEKIGASVGVSIYPDQGELLRDLVRFADLAMYQAKKQGKNQFVLYSDTLNQSETS